MNHMSLYSIIVPNTLTKHGDGLATSQRREGIERRLTWWDLEVHQLKDLILLHDLLPLHPIRRQRINYNQLLLSQWGKVKSFNAPVTQQSNPERPTQHWRPESSVRQVEHLRTLELLTWSSPSHSSWSLRSSACGQRSRTLPLRVLAIHLPTRSWLIGVHLEPHPKFVKSCVRWDLPKKGSQWARKRGEMGGRWLSIPLMSKVTDLGCFTSSTKVNFSSPKVCS